MGANKELIRPVVGLGIIKVGTHLRERSLGRVSAKGRSDNSHETTLASCKRFCRDDYIYCPREPGTHFKPAGIRAQGGGVN